MKPDVRSVAQVHVTDWSGVTRIDLNQVGARVPNELLSGAGAEWEAARKRWGEEQNDAICDLMTEVAGRYGGGFDSYVEWTATYGALYDGNDMRVKRRDRFTDPYRAAITTLGWVDTRQPWGTRIQATAYVPNDSSVPFTRELWRPKALYDTEFMALAPAVVVGFGGVRFLYVSGVVAWDENINPLYSDDPVRQIRHVLETIVAVFEEAGGTRADVVRLRPFTHSPKTARIIRDQVASMWRGVAPPSLLIADDINFGNPPKLHTEIQVMGVVAGSHVPTHGVIDPPSLVGGDRSLTIRTTRARDWELVHISEVRATPHGNVHREGADVVARLAACMEQAGIIKNDVVLAMVYCSSDAVAEAFRKEAVSVLPDSAIHLIPSRPMRELDGTHIKVELTARRLVE